MSREGVHLLDCYFVKEEWWFLATQAGNALGSDYLSDVQNVVIRTGTRTTKTVETIIFGQDLLKNKIP